MNTILIWILAIVALGLFVYFVPYRNIKLVQKKLDTVIELLNKKNNHNDFLFLFLYISRFFNIF